MSSLGEDIDAAAIEADLKGALNRTLRQLAQEKQRKADLVDAVYRAARDAASALTVAPVPRPPPDRRRGGEEVAVPLVSDLQLAKVTPDYSSAVCEQRMHVYADKIIALTNIQRADHPVRRATVLALGDIIEGELIFPGQAFLVDASLFRQVSVDGPRIMLDFFRRLLSTFETVHVEWVIGNHGRIGGRSSKDMDPESNGDRMLGETLRMVFDLIGEKRITFNVPQGGRERNWYSVARVGNWSALCLHGDQIRGHSGFPWYGLGKKVNGWASGAIREPFVDVAMGHWHQRSLIPLNKRNVYVNGSTESYNTYAQENLAAMSDPSQWLLFVHPEKGRVTATYGVDLT